MNDIITLNLTVGFFKSHKLDRGPTNVIVMITLTSKEKGLLNTVQSNFNYKDVSQFEAVMLSLKRSLSSLPESIRRVKSVMGDLNEFKIEIVTTERAMKNTIDRINELVDFMDDTRPMSLQEQLDIYWRVEPRVPKTYQTSSAIALSLYEGQKQTRLTFERTFGPQHKSNLCMLSKQCKTLLRDGLFEPKQNNVIDFSKEKGNG